jgi:hypothetical protein
VIEFNERRLLVIDADQITKTVPVSDPEARRILGIEHYDDPDQAARRMVRQGVPHLRIGRRIRFSIPALKNWAAEQLNNAASARAGAQTKEAPNQGESLAATA